MQKSYLHNGKSINDATDNKEYSPSQYSNQKRIVDINKILNRVEVDKKNEKNKKVIFFSIGILIIALMGIFITIVK